jgi:hypothetical protein
MRAWWVVVVVLALPARASAQVPVPPEPPPEPVIPIGAGAAGLDIGGLTLTAAAAKLHQAFDAGLLRPIQTRVAGHRKQLRPADLGLVFDARKTARRANIAGARRSSRATPACA